MSIREQQVALTGSGCAWGMLQVRAALRALPSGFRLRVFTADAGLRPDLEALARQAGYRVAASAIADVTEFVIERG